MSYLCETTRGLRPLFPYLFILCAEGITPLIKHVEGRGLVQGVQICSRSHYL